MFNVYSQHCTFVFSYHINSLFQIQIVMVFISLDPENKKRRFKTFLVQKKNVKNVFCNYIINTLFYIHFQLLL